MYLGEEVREPVCHVRLADEMSVGYWPTQDLPGWRRYGDFARPTFPAEAFRLYVTMRSMLMQEFMPQPPEPMTEINLALNYFEAVTDYHFIPRAEDPVIQHAIRRAHQKLLRYDHQ